jgi:hypothetical protein
VYKGEKAFERSIDIPASLGISENRAVDLLRTITKECPELFMCSGNYEYTEKEVVTEVEPEYIMAKKDYENLMEKIKSTISDLHKTTVENDDYDTEIYAHDKVCEMCSYSEEGKYSGLACGPLVYGKAKCQGYAAAFQLVMQELGYTCLLVDSDSMNHAWNIICVDNDYYQVDLTWDDCSDKRQCYAYFNLNDDMMDKLSHNYEKKLRFIYPVCGSLKDNYYIKTGNYIMAKDDLKKLYFSKLDEAYAKGGGEFEIMLENTYQYDELVDQSGSWLQEWNLQKNVSICTDRQKIEGNSLVYIESFKFGS